jgi:hypothetical protein
MAIMSNWIKVNLIPMDINIPRIHLFVYINSDLDIAKSISKIKVHSKLDLESACFYASEKNV